MRSEKCNSHWPTMLGATIWALPCHVWWWPLCAPNHGPTFVQVGEGSQPNCQAKTCTLGALHQLFNIWQQSGSCWPRLQNLMQSQASTQSHLVVGGNQPLLHFGLGFPNAFPIETTQKPIGTLTHALDVTKWGLLVRGDRSLSPDTQGTVVCSTLQYFFL